jgi:hypothetical protein
LLAISPGNLNLTLVAAYRLPLIKWRALIKAFLAKLNDLWGIESTRLTGVSQIELGELQN